MESTYFLGANSADGFYSLYREFCSDEGDYLSVIKGGPGTGKSSFMRAIGRRAEELGLDVEYVLCSGSPDSLDGVYIPSLRRGWVDGTAPHAIEPRRFGLDGEYIDLGSFCQTPFSGDTGAPEALYSSYKACYNRAYSFLSAAESLRRAFSREITEPEAAEKLRVRILRIIRQRSEEKGNTHGGRRRRFYRALSSQGDIRLSGEIEKLCPVIYTLSDGFGLDTAAAEAERLELEHIISPCPRAPGRIEALLLPRLGLGFVSDVFDCGNVKNIRLQAPSDKERPRAARAALREGRRLEGRMEALALNEFKEADRLHGELEAHCISRMDHAALTEFTQWSIAEIFT